MLGNGHDNHRRRKHGCHHTEDDCQRSEQVHETRKIATEMAGQHMPALVDRNLAMTAVAIAELLEEVGR
jgi:hypothetical protein